ncbi:beta-mannosidase [Vibrio sp. 10N.286.49.C2]|uniref:glycoside hydrolase family 2 protein n=1 Tax=unclassified Vibrio TaxID=2614977 RepID=UPI000C839FFF|nr:MULTISPECIES: sugar-binding domain-containing protein [unclassified Vibrio]PMH31544.1 beta-mannosidase [Vibrio sp. 10N.286.49.C2]PMH50566.1 beta-mannosidase [Vibrio sp. 10N.286.49.B1]
MRRIGWVVIYILLQGCTSQRLDSNVSTLSLDGQWQFTSITASPRSNQPSFETYNQSLHVPANWYSEGVDFAGQALYETSFELEKKYIQSRYWLSFQAVDYAADVSLNNIPIGSHVGYFAPFSFDVTSFIKEKTNELSVMVKSENDDKVQDWSLNKKELKGVLNHHDTRPGGAWSERGQDANSGGIWGSVDIKRTGPVAIREVKFTPILQDNGESSGQLNILLNSSLSGESFVEISLVPPQEVDMRTRRESYVVRTRLNEGDNLMQWTVPSTKRALWWPYDWGKPNLYDLKVTVYLADQPVSDYVQQRIGFRKVEYSESKKHFYINDLPYFIRGTNYIASQWLGEVSRQDYADDLDLMREANVNSIRVHGHVAGKAFYDLADELGFVVWQDFPLQWGYEESLATSAEASRQAKDMTSMLFNHPSIAFWSGHNEPPWDATWMKYKYPSYERSHNKQLTDSVYSALVESQDGRVVRKASYTYEHPWYGWYSGHYTDYKKLTGPPIISEFGAQAFPRFELLASILSDTDSWPLNTQQLDQLDYHNFQRHETLELAKIEMGQNLNDFIVNSQDYQRTVNKYAAENLRLKKNKGIAAIYQFMFVDSWPSITWSVLDVERQKKPGFLALKQSFQPILPIVSVNNESSSKLIKISIINDSRASVSNTLVVINCVVPNKEPRKCWQKEHIDIKTNDITTIANIERGKITDEFVINIIGSQGELISSNHYQPGDY